jgi:hypothetical protein
MVKKGCASNCINNFISLEQCQKGHEANCIICCSNDKCNTDPKEEPKDEIENMLTFLDPLPPQCIDQQPIQISCVEVMHVVRLANGFIEPTPISWPTISDNSPGRKSVCFYNSPI